MQSIPSFEYGLSCGIHQNFYAVKYLLRILTGTLNKQQGGTVAGYPLRNRSQSFHYDGVPNSGIVPELGRVPYDVTLDNGQSVSAGERLTVLDSGNPGSLTVSSTSYAAGIGGREWEDGGNMTFNGGVITATSAVGSGTANTGSAAGIGGGGGTAGISIPG